MPLAAFARPLSSDSIILSRIAILAILRRYIKPEYLSYNTCQPIFSLISFDISSSVQTYVSSMSVCLCVYLCVHLCVCLLGARGRQAERQGERHTDKETE